MGERAKDGRLRVDPPCEFDHRYQATWVIEVCDHCGENDNWRCGHGMCVDGNPEPSFTAVNVCRVSAAKKLVDGLARAIEREHDLDRAIERAVEKLEEDPLNQEPTKVADYLDALLGHVQAGRFDTEPECEECGGEMGCPDCTKEKGAGE